MARVQFSNSERLPIKARWRLAIQRADLTHQQTLAGASSIGHLTNCTEQWHSSRYKHFWEICYWNYQSLIFSLTPVAFSVSRASSIVIVTSGHMFCGSHQSFLVPLSLKLYPVPQLYRQQIWFPLPHADKAITGVFYEKFHHHLLKVVGST